jgi:hypothetical protein
VCPLPIDLSARMRVAKSLSCSVVTPTLSCSVVAVRTLFPNISMLGAASVTLQDYVYAIYVMRLYISYMLSQQHGQHRPGLRPHHHIVQMLMAGGQSVLGIAPPRARF